MGFCVAAKGANTGQRFFFFPSFFLDRSLACKMRSRCLRPHRGGRSLAVGEKGSRPHRALIHAETCRHADTRRSAYIMPCRTGQILKKKKKKSLPCGVVSGGVMLRTVHEVSRAVLCCPAHIHRARMVSPLVKDFTNTRPETLYCECGYMYKVVYEFSKESIPTYPPHLTTSAVRPGQEHLYILVDVQI